MGIFVFGRPHWRFANSFKRFRWQRKMVLINARPAAEFGMGLGSVVARALAWRKRPGSECVSDGLFGGGNAGPAKGPPGSVRNPNVGKRSHIAFMRRRRECLVVNPRPTTHLDV